MKEFFLNILGSIELSTLEKLAIASLIGLVIGLERELRRKPTGIRTLLIIAVASCLLTIISIKSVINYSTISQHINMDPLRLPAQVVSGIGFIGAGVIFRRHNDAVSGLTTAAIVWGVSGLGIAIGAGFISEAILATLFFLFGVNVLPWFVQKTTKVNLDEKVILLKLSISSDVETSKIMKKIKDCHIKIKNVKVKDEKEKQKVLEIRGYVNSKIYVTNIYDEISKETGIEKLEISE